MKKYLLLLASVCLLGSSALAQDRGIMQYVVTDVIDFTPYGNAGYNGYSRLSFDNDRHPQIDGNVISERLTVESANKNVWSLYGSDTYNETYLQLQPNQGTQNATISDLKAGDVVTIWGECGNADGGDFNIYGSVEPRNTTYYEYQGKNYPNSKEYLINNSGPVQVQCNGNYSGIRKIEIKSLVRAEDYFNYDPGFEDYDMYDEFSENNEKKCYNNENENGKPYTSYSLSNEGTGIEYNDGHIAKYIVLSNSKISANNRIAIDGNAGTWRFNYGLRAPNDGKWANFSICNLKEGDRVVFSYTGTAPVFSSVAGGADAPTGPYNGSKAFFDQYNDGQFDEGEDVYITPGATPETDWSRPEGNFYKEDHDCSQGNYVLYYTRYVITEDGHLDLAIAPDTRIVHIKIYSDHQATMIDEYDTQTESYVAKFDITGELQANEHIMPGGLEVHVGSDDASQHANVVSSPHGPVSIVNAVDGFKLPGMSRGDDGELDFVFDLANNIPKTGTFYKFMPLEDGKMKLTFQAVNMNYYTYGINGDETYVGDISSYGDNIWLLEWDRPNEQTVDVNCPYYLVKIDKNGNKTVTTYNDVGNGAERTTPEINVLEGETYYLYGGWNGDVSQLSYTSSGWGNNNIEYFPSGAGNGGAQKACGVARLLEVVFNPNRKVYPLAKWVPNGTSVVGYDDENVLHGVPNPDTFAAETYLADLWGYNKDTKITVKKMSGNILTCNPYIEEIPQNQQVEDGPTARLMIKDIKFVDGKDKGGTILIKIGNTDNKSNPVYTLTIAYSADPTYDGNSGTGTRGHIWDFSTNSLHGFDWAPGSNEAPKRNNNGDFINDLSASSKYAQPVDYGHYFDDYFAADISGYSSADDVFTKLEKSGSGLLHDEIHAEGTHSRNSDWSFNYNLVNAGNLYDPLFMNKYDLEGDNADLIWETEGTVIIADANASVMFNEFTGSDIHSSEKDPERYVGILNSKNSEFRIPWLMPNDRVIIYMGTGKGAFNDQAVFNIRGAYDAVHNVIDPTDDYIVGGSHWNVVKNEQGQVVTNDPYYRGCYHFFAQGHNGGPADMVFKMTSGSMCKIYSIQIYRGDRIITNEIVGATEDDNKFLLWSTDDDPNEEGTSNNKSDTYNWTLKYFGKDQQLANGDKGNTVQTNLKAQNNEIIAQTGKYELEENKTTPALTNNYVKVSQVNTETGETEEIATSKVESFTYQHQLGEIGTFRVRGKDMEKNMNYVADYADHNVTVAYQETQPYPYTWDFRDITGFGNIDNLFQPEENIGEVRPKNLTETVWNSLANTSYQKTARDLSLWEVNGTTGECSLRLNSQSQTPPNLMEKDNIFETAKEIDGNQFWANGVVVPETQGLWFYTEDNYRDNCQWIIDGNGMKFNGYNGGTLVVPNVPAGAAVYLRMAALKTDVTKCTFTHQFKDEDGVRTCETYSPQQVGNTNEYIFAIRNNGSKKGKLALSIEGYQLKKLGVSIDKKTLSDYGWATESRERVIDPSLTAYLSGKNIETIIATGAVYASRSVSLQRMDLNEKGDLMQLAEADGSKYACILHNADKDERVTVLDGGFHLFVPDMHDYDVKTPANSQKKFTLAEKSIMKAQLTASQVKWSDDNGDTKNFVLTNTYLRVGKDDEITESISTAKEEGFYRVGKKSPIQSSGHQGYLPVSTPVAGGSAKFSIVFIDFEDNFQGITTGITEATPNNENGQMINENAEWYNLNGQKLNGMPNERGIYIVNGKKVMVK
jgi:hypothetical protein